MAANSAPPADNHARRRPLGVQPERTVLVRPAIRAQQTDRSPSAAGTFPTLVAASTAGPDAVACTASRRPGHNALKGPNTSPVTSTCTQPASPDAGLRSASAPLWHQSLRTTEAPGVHQRHPSPVAAACATASCAAAAISAAPASGTALSAAGSGTSPTAAGSGTSPTAAAWFQIARRPADAAASACDLAPVTNSACTPSNRNSTTTAGHTISSGSTSPRSLRPEARSLP